ncbi:MAG: type II toxin-antitoxin system VapC family toxin [Gemmatimonadota bacterium]
MTFLLDTHALLWWVTDDPRLSALARERIRDPENVILVSSASGWEITTKHRLGKLRFQDWDPQTLPASLRKDRIEVLPISLGHALLAGSLPGPHRDPFDRILIAQSRMEDLPILTRDPVFPDYGVDAIW